METVHHLVDSGGHLIEAIVELAVGEQLPHRAFARLGRSVVASMFDIVQRGLRHGLVVQETASAPWPE